MTLWSCPAPGCGALVYRRPGETASCPRCGSAIETNPRTVVEATKAEAEARKARRTGKGKGAGVWASRTFQLAALDTGSLPPLTHCQIEGDKASARGQR